MNPTPSPMSPQRLAIDLRRALTELAEERVRTEKLFVEIDRQNAEIDKLLSTTRREHDSRLQAEGKLDKTLERLQLAVNAAGLALWDWLVVAPDAFLTARWGEMLGTVAVEGTWTMRELANLVHPEDRERVRATVQGLIGGHPGPHIAQYRIRTSQGWLWIESHGIVAERDQQAKPLRLIGTHADISERVRKNEEVAQARRLADQASQAKSDFVANISHEVRTPLNALMGLTQLLMDSVLNPDQKRWIDLMDSSAKALLHLVNDVLDLSRIEAGKLELEKLDFDLQDLLREVTDICSEQARAKSIALSLVLAPQLPRKMQGDPNRLRQVLLNLLSNALKFTPPQGEISLSAGFKCAEPGLANAELVLRVKDTGAGIANEVQAQIFEAFSQADVSTSRRYGGSGLGLAICAQLMQLMGGRIELTSALDHGSTFAIALPWAQRSLDAEKNPPSKAPALSLKDQLATDRFSGLSVMVADDHPVNVLFLKELLNRLGCKLRVANNGLEAVAQWQLGGVDLVLMDVQMPGASGLQAAQQIRKHEAQGRLPRTPIVAVTANAANSDRENCLAAGMDGYLSKPIRPAALLEAMDKACADLATREKKADAALPVQLPVVMHPLPQAPQDAQDLLIDPDTLRKMTAMLKADMPQRKALLVQAMDAKNLALALEQIHFMRGAVGLVGAERAMRLIQGLEVTARSGDWRVFEKVLPLLEDSVDRLEG
jgi:signal transduction histidine kinase/DNA-binding response OmpR family regulator